MVMKSVHLAISVTLLFVAPSYGEDLRDLIVEHHFEFIPSGARHSPIIRQFDGQIDSMNRRCPVWGRDAAG